MDRCSAGVPPALPTEQLPFLNIARSEIVFVLPLEGLLEVFLLLFANSFCQSLNSKARAPCPKASSGFSDDLAVEDQSCPPQRSGKVEAPLRAALLDFLFFRMDVGKKGKAA